MNPAAALHENIAAKPGRHQLTSVDQKAASEATVAQSQAGMRRYSASIAACLARFLAHLPAVQSNEAVENQNWHQTDEAMSEPEKGASVTIRIQAGRAQVVANDATIDSLRSILASQPESSKHPLINKTGLTGRYDWSLRWTPDTLRGPEAEDKNAEQPSLITSLHEQLGLRLISEKDQIEAIAIDHVEIPSDN